MTIPQSHANGVALSVDRIAAAGLRSFGRIAELWRLSVDDQLCLLGQPSRSTDAHACKRRPTSSGKPNKPRRNSGCSKFAPFSDPVDRFDARNAPASKPGAAQSTQQDSVCRAYSQCFVAWAPHFGHRQGPKKGIMAPRRPEPSAPPRPLTAVAPTRFSGGLRPRLWPTLPARAANRPSQCRHP